MSGQKVIHSFVDMDIVKNIDLIKADGTKKPASEVFAGKEFICIYFSGHWCPPCRGFTPVLKKFYQVCTLRNLKTFLNLIRVSTIPGGQ